MPWNNQELRDKMGNYKKIFDKLNDGKDDDIVLKETVVRNEILKRDFSKRQINIIFFIYTLSYLLFKEKALVPKLQDFELCGVSKTSIKKEIEKLEGWNVITWDKEENTFTINAPTIWKAPYHDGYNLERASELFFKNLQQTGIDIMPYTKKAKRG